jgi:hypothetical protein
MCAFRVSAPTPPSVTGSSGSNLNLTGIAKAFHVRLAAQFSSARLLRYSPGSAALSFGVIGGGFGAPAPPLLHRVAAAER